jgi:hypothetical protein
LLKVSDFGYVSYPTDILCIEFIYVISLLRCLKVLYFVKVGYVTEISMAQSFVTKVYLISNYVKVTSGSDKRVHSF